MKKIFFLFSIFLSAFLFSQNLFAKDSPVRIETTVMDKSEVTNSIKLKFEITNSGSDKIKLSKLKLNYFYTIDSKMNQTFWCDHAGVNTKESPYYIELTQNITGKFSNIKMNNNADSVFEISYNGKEVLNPNDKLSIEIRFAKNDWSNYIQSNDYSFSNEKEINSNKVDLIINNNLINGKGSVNDPIKVEIGSKIYDEKSDMLTVPVNFSNIPKIVNFNFSIKFDQNILNLESVDSELSKSYRLDYTSNNGIATILFMDYSLGNREKIWEDGKHLDLKFSIKKLGKTKIEVLTKEVKDYEWDFGGYNFKHLDSEFTNSNIEIKNYVPQIKFIDKGYKLKDYNYSSYKDEEMSIQKIFNSNTDISSGNFNIKYDPKIIKFLSIDKLDGMTYNEETKGLVNVNIKNIKAKSKWEMHFKTIDVGSSDIEIDQNSVFTSDDNLKFNIDSERLARISVLEETIKVKLTNIGAKLSNNVSIPVSLKNYNNCKKFNMKIKYDAEFLDYKSYKLLSGFKDQSNFTLKNESLGEIFIEVDNEHFSTENDLFQLNFNSKKIGNTELKLIEGKFYDINDIEIPLITINNSQISIAE